MGSTPPTIENSVFGGGSYPIYVAKESVETYKNAPTWSGLASRIKAAIDF